jgi:organic hydroperoxide reductase OsmC/OhrA
MPYSVKITWQKNLTEAFVDNKYNRTHQWFFDGGIQVVASSSPHVVPLPMSNENAVDPEEALVASVSSCHMLWFLSIAAERKWVVENYEDNADGILGKNDLGQLAMTKITLNPKVIFNNKILPRLEEINELHDLAHKKCFIANSLKTKIEIITIM